MEAGVTPRSGLAWRLWALAPIVLLAVVVAAFVSRGESLVDLIGGTRRPLTRSTSAA